MNQILQNFRMAASQSYGPGQYELGYEENSIDCPIGYVHWTENRNMEELLRLLSAGRSDIKSMVSHTFLTSCQVLEASMTREPQSINISEALNSGTM